MAEAAKTTGTGADVQAEFEALRQDISNLSAAVSRLVGESANEAGDRVRDRAREAATATRQAANTAGTKVSDFVDERPGTSLLIAFGAGLVFGTFLRRH